ncbi:hypothetical protein [Novosphingobium sp.]|uniref:hypothetical protein n=1 Tax=Novosphingobium sp. TaxID=1874826 RepID=UPI00286DB506|nr:hypothetical protein [Novosphingobium sp.]
MKQARIALAAALLVTSAIAIAQQGPESLLPPGFDKPQPKAAAQAPASSGGPTTISSPVVQSIPGRSAPSTGSVTLPAAIPSLDRIEKMSPEELATLLGNKPKFDVPAGARREMKRLGVLDESEGGLPSWTFAGQNASLVRAVLAGNNGQLVSRWGHILLRRALASRLDAPSGMTPAEFAALRASLLVRMGEGVAARELLQDIDAANYSPALSQAALDAYVQTGDFTGACPVVTFQGGARKDNQWKVFQAICSAYSGEGSRAMTVLDRLTPGSGVERIDVLLAQKYAGAANRGQRAVKIEWDGVEGMTPLRYNLALAVGLEPPASLTASSPASLRANPASSPFAPLELRASAADFAAGQGVLSSTAMVDLYSQVFALGGAGDWASRAGQLQAAYLAASDKEKVAAITALWGDRSVTLQFYSRQVLTAYAAARLPVSSDFLEESPGLIASMLSAGLDENAVKWGAVVPNGSEGWALLALAQANRTAEVSRDQIDTFRAADESEEQAKTRMFIAGLAGLRRISQQTGNDLASDMGFSLAADSRWAQAIDQAAAVNNPGLVAILAGVGMQGPTWSKMTPRHLYHIVAALDRVGLRAEARMIAAEAVARA